MNFLFQCSRCGRHPVNEATFYAVITPDLKRKLEERIQNGLVVNAVVKFKSDFCLLCKPGLEFDGDVSLEIESLSEDD